jgi:hypothetical protein
MVSPPHPVAARLKTLAQRLASVTGWSGGCALLLVLVGVLALCAEVLSPALFSGQDMRRPGSTSVGR